MVKQPLTFAKAEKIFQKWLDEHAPGETTIGEGSEDDKVILVGSTGYEGPVMVVDKATHEVVELPFIRLQGLRDMKL